MFHHFRFHFRTYRIKLNKKHFLPSTTGLIGAEKSPRCRARYPSYGFSRGQRALFVEAQKDVERKKLNLRTYSPYMQIISCFCRPVAQSNADYLLLKTCQITENSTRTYGVRPSGWGQFTYNFCNLHVIQQATYQRQMEKKLPLFPHPNHIFLRPPQEP